MIETLVIFGVFLFLCDRAGRMFFKKAGETVRNIASDPEKAEGAVRVAKTGVKIARMILMR